MAPSPLPLAGPCEAQCWLIAASRDPGQHSADMSKTLSSHSRPGMQLPAALCFGSVGVAAHGEGRSSGSLITSCLGGSPLS